MSMSRMTLEASVDVVRWHQQESHGKYEVWLGLCEITDIIPESKGLGEWSPYALDRVALTLVSSDGKTKRKFECMGRGTSGHKVHYLFQHKAMDAEFNGLDIRLYVEI